MRGEERREERTEDEERRLDERGERKGEEEDRKGGEERGGLSTSTQHSFRRLHGTTHMLLT